MSHSITTTASYVLNKYSRSYPSTSHRGTQGPAESEWQHFTNPVMRIILEAKKSPSGQLVSMRLRILWSIHSESNDLDVDHDEVVFEDMELLSFSSLPAFQMSAALQSDQGLPLKAVYRDGVVGIRYLHPKVVTLGSQPASYHTYRRFQITFKDALDASQFIDAIKSVCPCKSNPQPAHINRHSTMLPTTLTRTATTTSGFAPVRPARLVERQGTVPTSTDLRHLPPTVRGDIMENQTLSVELSAATSLSSDDSAFVTCSETSYRTGSRVLVNPHPNGVLPKHRGRDLAQSSLPNSSQPSSLDQCIAMPPPPVPRHATHSADAATLATPGMANTDDQRSQFLASLSEMPSLYELSPAELENLVSQIIREEGFLQLLESLDSLWKVKGLIDR